MICLAEPPRDRRSTSAWLTTGFLPRRRLAERGGDVSVVRGLKGRSRLYQINRGGPQVLGAVRVVLGDGVSGRQRPVRSEFLSVMPGDRETEPDQYLSLIELKFVYGRPERSKPLLRHQIHEFVRKYHCANTVRFWLNTGAA